MWAQTLIGWSYGNRTARQTASSGSPLAGSLSGSVQEAGAAVPNCVVRAYERKTGLMVAETRSDSSGDFTIAGLSKGSNNYYVIALDPEGGAIYNALIFDRVTPL